MSFRGFFKDVSKVFLGDSMKSVLAGVKEKVEETIEETQKKIEIVTARVIKTLVVFLICALGFIFALVGLATYLTETVPRFDHGLGYLVVGGVLVLLGLVVKVLR
ncbi:hypothetical protein CMO92_03700 [Candidatus Woesearchaeota archaeon]|nr:hypothetical protein [Candidatus Woesearchaeota archaeon]|tara:strand:+ start:2425 stop:2739 length:315 start_codon:yes stop_codon:yes gene_type:complete